MPQKIIRLSWNQAPICRHTQDTSRNSLVHRIHDGNIGKSGFHIGQSERTLEQISAKIPEQQWPSSAAAIGKFRKPKRSYQVQPVFRNGLEIRSCAIRNRLGSLGQGIPARRNFQITVFLSLFAVLMQNVTHLLQGSLLSTW